MRETQKILLVKLICFSKNYTSPVMSRYTAYPWIEAMNDRQLCFNEGEMAHLAR